MKKRFLSLFLTIIMIMSVSPCCLAKSEITSNNVTFGIRLVITEDGSLYTWGSNWNGELGIDKDVTYETTEPTKVMDNIISADMSGYHTVAVSNDGSLYTWGDVEWGSYKVNRGYYRPHKIMDNVIFALAGNSYCMAITSDNSLYKWESSPEKGVTTPKKILDDVITINTDCAFGMAITSNGTLYKCGSYDYKYLPEKIMDDVASLCTSSDHYMVIKKDGSLYTWGSNEHGELGNGSTEYTDIPQKILDNVVSVSAGGGWDYNYSMAVTNDGTLYTLGDNLYGQLGNGKSGENEFSTTPQKIMNNIESVYAGGEHSLAITKDGDLYAWGENYHGEVGNNKSGENQISKIPQKVLSNVVSMCASADTSSALTRDGKLYMWGKNFGWFGSDHEVEFYPTPQKIMDNVMLPNNIIVPKPTPIDPITPEFYIDNGYCIENNKNDIWGSVSISGNTQNIEDITGNITWKSSDTSVAEIEQVSYINAEDEKSALIDIEISGHKIGKATITGTTADGRTATATVGVEPKLKPLTLNYDEGSAPETIEYKISTESNNREYFEEFLSKLTYTGLFDDSSVSYEISSDNKTAAVSITTKLLAGDNTINVASPYGQSADIKVSVKENLDFTLRRDNQKFSHSTFNFFEDTKIKTKLYPVSEKYYKAWERMVEQGIITKKQYLDLVNDSNKEGVPYDEDKGLQEWGGACFGLATTLLSSFDNVTTKLKYTTFDSEATGFFEISSVPKSNTELRDVIFFYHPLQSYIKFSAGMYNDLIGLGQSLYGADWTTDKKNFWDSLADAASYIHTGPVTPLMLCYLEKNGSGHVIIICDFEDTEDEYKFEFYDVNSVGTTPPQTLSGSINTFSVNKNDYTFDLVDASGKKIYEEWRCLKYYNALDIQSLIGSINYVDENYSVSSKSVTGKDNNSVIFKFKSDSDFTLSNGANKSLKYNNGTFDSDITIYDFDFESNGNGSYITLTLDNDNTYVYTGSDSSDFTIYNDNMYYSCNSQGADTITISENNIKLAGNTISADVTIGLDKELVNISGKAVDNIEMTLDNETVKCESDNSISDIVVSTIKRNEKTEENIENSDNFEFSVKEAETDSKPNNNENTTGGGGGGGSVSSYTVKFETYGGNVIESVKVAKNKTVAEPTAPTKDGFEFAGWYTDKDLKTKYDFSEKATKSFTLYAAWTEKKAEVKDDKTEPTTPENKITFTDVAGNEWFADNVKYVFENGLMNGVTNTEFAPNDNLTRAMLVAILYRAEGEPAVNKSIPFADVKADDYFANAVIWAQQNGIVSGVSENEFAPNENITREQIAAIIYRFANYKGYDTSAKADISAYTDYNEISEYAVEAMQYTVENGLIKGKTETTLNPTDTATRAEIAAILQRFIEANK